MQENNFEKQVQEKIDELKLKPSDEVWQKINVSINKGTRKRRVFAITLLLLLLMGSGVFLILNQTAMIKSAKQAPQNKEQAQVDNNNKLYDHSSGRNTTAKAGKNSSANNEASPVLPSAKFGSAIRGYPALQRKYLAAAENTNDRETKSYRFLSHDKHGNSLQDTTAHLQIDQNYNSGDNELTPPSPPKQNTITYISRQKQSILINKPVPGEMAEDSVALTPQDRTKNSKLIAGKDDPSLKAPAKSVYTMQEENKVKNDSLVASSMIPAKTGSVSKNAAAFKNIRKWQVGVNFSIGIAATKNGLLAIIGSGNSDFDKALSDVTSPNGSNSGASPVHIPSKIKKGLGLIAGVYIQRNISAKTALLLGVNYKLYNSAMMIGSRVDSVINMYLNNSFYRSGNTENYHNHFHFVEVPVNVRYKLSKQKQLPVYINAGISFSRLVSSHALQFDPVSGTYYNNKELFNKTLVNVSAGLLFSLSRTAKNPFLIGPDINYSLNSIADVGLYNNRHYSYFGIIFQKTLGKN